MPANQTNLCDRAEPHDPHGTCPGLPCQRCGHAWALHNRDRCIHCLSCHWGRPVEFSDSTRGGAA